MLQPETLHKKAGHFEFGTNALQQLRIIQLIQAMTRQLVSTMS